MPTYRLYRLTKENKMIGAVEIFECGTDDEAIEKAKQQANGRDIELWESSRLVTYLKSPASELGCKDEHPSAAAQAALVPARRFAP